MSATTSPSDAPTTGASGESSPPRLVWVNIAATVVGLLALVAVLVALHLGHLYDIFNSDSSYLPLVLEDILEDPANFRHWYPPTTSFYFPEWILFGLPYLITRSFYFSMAAVIVLHTLILFFIVYGINRKIDRSLAWVTSVATTVLLLFLGLHDGYVLEYEPFLSSFRLIFYTLYHYGAWLMSLLSFLVLLKIQTRPTNRQYLLRISLLGLVVFLTSMSDQIMLVWFSGPAIATLGYRWLTTRAATSHTTQTRRIYLTMGVIAVTSIAGKLTYPLTVVHDFATYNTRISFNGLVKEIQTIAFHTALDLSLFPVVVCWVVGLHLLILLWFVRYRKKFANTPTPLQLSMVYTLMTFIAIATAVLFTHSQFSKRYFLPTYILTVILTPSLAIYWYRNHISAKGYKGGTITRRISYVLLMVCGVLLQVTVLRIVQKNDEIQPNIFAYTFDELQCVDRVIARYNLRYGVGSHDYARSLQAMSAHDIEVANYFYDEANTTIAELHWLTSAQYFRASYDFAIAGIDSVTKNFNQEWRHIFLRDHPPPAHRVVCGSKEIFIYPHGGLVMNPK